MALLNLFKIKMKIIFFQVFDFFKEKFQKKLYKQKGKQKE